MPRSTTVVDGAERDEALRALWKATPDNLKGKLPKPLRKDGERGKCNECGGFHVLPAVHLDYLGHADTCRLIAEVDPYWQWAPMAGWTDTGEPVFVRDRNNNPIALWITLTILDVTRPGVGTVAAGKSDAEKELIGDAIRNAAMRFGVGADMWSKASHIDEDDDRRAPDRSSQSDDPDGWFKRHGWKDRAEEQAWRKTFTERGKQLSDDDRSLFKEDCAIAGLVWSEGIPKPVADEVDKLFAMYLAPSAYAPGHDPANADRVCDRCGEPIGPDGNCGCPF